MSRLRTRAGLNRFAPRLELLDDRVVPSCTTVLEDGVLRIEGDDLSNLIDVVDDGTTVTVTCDGTSEEFTDVTEIEVRGGNGQDVVTYDLTVADPAEGETAVAVNRVLDVKLGNGVDSFEGSVTGDLAAGSSLEVCAKGCNGRDSLTFDLAGQVAADVTVDVDLFGGNGRDVIVSSYAGVLLGTLEWDVTGGNGKDELSATMTFDAGSTGSADVEVRGERAPDAMTLLVTDNSGDDGNPDTEDLSTLGAGSEFTVYGGTHPDTADVTEDVVDVVSAKEVE